MFPTGNFEKTKKTGTPSPTHLYINNDIIYEILTWLPAKSLMRFKSISKFWNKIIIGDSYFIQLHWQRAGARSSKKLLLHFDDYKFGDGSFERIFLSTDIDGKNLMTEYTHRCPGQQNKVTAMDGLVCFYGDANSGFSASLHNLSTCESIALPEVSNFNKAFGKRSLIFIGFDSSHTLCKVLRKTNVIGPNIDEPVFEIYTVGGDNHSWRIIESPPYECCYCDNDGSGVCINGVIYWMSKCCRGYKIKAFDVSDEKFYLISNPPGCRLNYLRNVNGVLTLMSNVSWFSSSRFAMKLLKLEDYKNQVWVAESILVDVTPKQLSWMLPSVVDTIGSGEIVTIQSFETLIYHDRATRISKVVELLNELPPYPIVHGTYVENILPLTSIGN